jgi:hypothetical protein
MLWVMRVSSNANRANVLVRVRLSPFVILIMSLPHACRTTSIVLVLIISPILWRTSPCGHCLHDATIVETCGE